jgi:hypothetical protein
VSTSKLPVVVPSTSEVVDAGEVGEAVEAAGGLDRRPTCGSGGAARRGCRSRRCALADDADPVAQRLDLGEDVAREQHGAALGLASRMQSWNTASISGSSPEVGSSRTSSSTSEARAATRATFCRLPLE